jgi:hypothetical protein
MKFVFPINIILDAKRLPCATINKIGSLKSWAWGIFWPPSKQHTHATSSAMTTFVWWIRKSTQTSRIFLSTSLAPNSCNNEFVSP